MKTINLREYYPHCTTDDFVEVSDEVYETLLQSVRAERNQQRGARRHGTYYYSLEACEWLEREYLLDFETPETILLQQAAKARLYKALASLKPIQARRIYQRFLLGKTCIEIAQEEGVSRKAVYCSLNSGMKRLRRYFSKASRRDEVEP